MKNIIAILIFLSHSVVAQQVSNLKNSWLGNSNADPNTFMPQGIEGMSVSPDGTVYTNVLWEEGGGTYTQIKNQQVSHAKHTFGWGALGGSDICANSTYVYFSGIMGNEDGGLVDPERWPEEGKEWLILWRRDKNDIDNGPTFTGAKGHPLFKNYLVVKEINYNLETGGVITGVFANDEEVFVATGFENKVRIYDANTMAFKRAFTVTTPHQMAMDSFGKLWIAIGTNATKIERYDLNGIKQSQEVLLPANSFVGDFCIDSSNRILIGDVGQREQVLIYTNTNSSPSFTATFGLENGIYSGMSGKYEHLKFNQIRGIGTDNNGNIYVCNTQWGTGGEGTILESYNLTTGALNWSKYCVMFVDAMGIDAATDGKDIYGKVEHFTVDYSKPEGQEATLSGYTINKYKYPLDPRLYGELASVAVRNINGHKFLGMSSMNGSLDVIYRFNPATDGEVAIPCVMFGWSQDTLCPGSLSTPWIWRDLNANGQFESGEYKPCTAHVIPDGGYGATIDNNLDIWVAVGDSINHLKCLGLDANNVPIYDGIHTAIPKPTPFEEVRRVQYDVSLDRMYLGGATTNYPDYHPWRAMGRAIHRYDNWSQGNRITAGELVVPFDLLENTETVSFRAEGDYLFTAIDRGYTTFIDERENNDRPVMGQINIFNISDNSSAGFIRPVWDNIGWMDVVQCIDVYKRNNGEYIIIQEDDGRNKNIMYRWCPNADCNEIPTANADIHSQLSYSIYPNPSKDKLLVSGNLVENLNYEIISIEGKILQTGMVNRSSITIENLNAGIYVVKLSNKLGVWSHPFVKE